MSDSETAASKPAVPAPAVGFDPLAVKSRKGSSYPDAFRGVVGEREKRALGDAAGLTQFGVNLVHLPPGAWSAQRHWHTGEDEFVYLVAGELTLVTEAGEQRLKAGMTAGFPAGHRDGHHLVNRSGATAIYLEIGTRSDRDECHYPDIDLHLKPDAAGEPLWLHKDGRAY
ncbi:MAG: cupin domain-containing protein [Dongiaceae bacterium]